MSININALMTSENRPRVINVSGNVSSLRILPITALTKPKTAAIRSSAKNPPLTSTPGNSQAVRPMATAMASQVHKNLRTPESFATRSRQGFTPDG